MAKGLQILTANRLTDGAVVYWHDGGWENTLAKAEGFESEAEAKAALEAAKAWVADRVVVNPYLFEAALDDGVLVPVKEREAVRAAGPSVRTDLGKQAAGLYRSPPMHSQVRRARTTPGKAKDPFDVSI